MSYYLGVDIGTFESKGVLVDGDGKVVAMAARPHRMLVPQPGWAEHRPLEDWWGDFVFITKKLLAETGIAPADIRAIGPSAIGPCMLPVDRDGEPLMNGVLYGVDGRATREIAELTERIGAERLMTHCGNVLTTQSVGPKILWLKHQRPELYARTHMFLSASSFLVHRLTGEYVIDHHTAAGFTPLYDFRTGSWTMELAEDIVELERLPRILWGAEIAGQVTERAAAETGLAVGTPVTAGTVDAAAEALSVGVRRPGDMMLMYGSTIFIIMLTERPVSDPRLWYVPWLFQGEHASASGLATSGTLTHWFREQFARELDPQTAVRVLAEEAMASPPGAKGLICLPYFSGERTPIHDPNAKGVLFGFNLLHDRADTYRAVLEGIAYGTAHVFETYQDVGQAPAMVAAVGGGTRNQVWAQATSDVSGKAQVLREKSMGASFGNAFLAAVAVGDAERDEIDRWNKVAGEITPDPANAAVYARQFDIFKRLYRNTRELMAEL